MGRTSFVVMLFSMAAACLVLAGTEASWPWLLGALAFLVVGAVARRRYAEEQETGIEVTSGRFLAFALGTLGLGIAVIAWLASA